MNLKQIIHSSFIEKILTDRRDIFVIQTIALVKASDDGKKYVLSEFFFLSIQIHFHFIFSENLRIVEKQPYIIIRKKVVTPETPYLIYIVSFIVGVLFVLLITYIFYKVKSVNVTFCFE